MSTLNGQAADRRMPGAAEGGKPVTADPGRRPDSEGNYKPEHASQPAADDAAEVVRDAYAAENRQLRAAVAAGRDALEQARIAAEAEMQKLRDAYEGELKQLRGAVAAGREALEALQAQSREEFERGVSTRLAEATRVRETVQA